MNRKLFWVLVAGGVVMAATAWATYPSRRSKSIGDPSKFRYVHCPKCQREKMYSQGALDHPCQYCEVPLVGTEQSIQQTGTAGNPYGRMFIWIYVEVLLVMGAVYFIGRKRPGRAEEDLLYFNCDKCRQKIRYRVQQVGQTAMCRRCKHSFVYPEEGPDD